MTCHDERMSSVARRLSIRRFMLGNPVMRTVLSLWAWLVLGIVIIVWLPLVAIVWAVTAPFDQGRYAAGYLFRKLTVVHQTLNPLWHFHTSGVTITDPRSDRVRTATVPCRRTPSAASSKESVRYRVVISASFANSTSRRPNTPR